MIELVAQVVTRGKVKSKLMTKGNGLSAAKYQVSHQISIRKKNTNLQIFLRMENRIVLNTPKKGGHGLTVKQELCKFLISVRFRVSPPLLDFEYNRI